MRECLNLMRGLLSLVDADFPPKARVLRELSEFPRDMLHLISL